MSYAKVTLTVVQGHLRNKTFPLGERTPCVVGRSRECDIVIPADPDSVAVSRYHCMFETEGPTISIRDLASLNGTFVNGKKLGQRLTAKLASADCLCEPAFQKLKGGDQVQVGNTIFRVDVVSPTDVADPTAVP
jgi:eukaryotic-like serine/threonine-protein kinase